MERNAFERLMGPAEEILKKEIEVYKRVNRSLSDGVQVSSVVASVQIWIRRSGNLFEYVCLD